MAEIKKTATQERDEARVAIAKSVIHQITALNKTIAAANNVGININFKLYGMNKSPEIESMYVGSGLNRMKNIYAEALK